MTGFPDYKIEKKEKLKKPPTPFCFDKECGEKEEIEEIIGCKVYSTNSFSGSQLIEIVKKFKKKVLQQVCKEIKKPFNKRIKELQKKRDSFSKVGGSRARYNFTIGDLMNLKEELLKKFQGEKE